MQIDPSVIEQHEGLREAKRMLDEANARRSAAAKDRDEAQGRLEAARSDCRAARRAWGIAWRAWAEVNFPAIAENQARYREVYEASAAEWRKLNAALAAILPHDDRPDPQGPFGL